MHDVQESRKLGHNTITTEHIVVALFSVGDVGSKRVLER